MIANPFNEMIKVATVCSGIGSPEVAISELNIPHEIVFACDIDKYARASYLANFKPGEMYNDMTAEDWIGEKYYSDLFIGGIPCQAFSLAGKRLGELDKRGLLFYDYYRYVQNQQPKVFIIENVKGLLSDANGKTFQNWLLLLGDSVNGNRQMFNHPDSLGYNLHWTVLNSKDFGVPQNRERVFIIGIRNDLPNDFRFPIGEKLTLRLKDILEPVVDEKYYLSDNFINAVTKHSDRHQEKGNGFKFEPTNGSGIAVSLTTKAGQRTTDNYILVPRWHKKVERRQTDSNNARIAEAPIELTQVGQLGGFESEGRIYDGNGISKTGWYLTGRESNPKIRRLTPLECWRLQGFPDECFYNAKNESVINSSKLDIENSKLEKTVKGMSDSQLYKQAGNSMTTKVMKAIIKNLLPILTT